jgi:8-oxo-dGTP pyrophosphatase MutT (NUDIX family)
MNVVDVLDHATLSAGVHLAHRIWRSRFGRYKIWKPETEVRVAFSVLLKINDGGRFLLVENLHRPGTFAPFGGVLKHRVGGSRVLDELQFRPHDVGPADDMTNDLRGFLPRKNLAALLSWYESGEDRETDSECLLRELSEELGEVGLAASIRIPKDLHFHIVRSIDDGPQRVPGVPLMQFRVFRVCEFVSTSQTTAFIRRLFEEVATTNSRLMIAGSDELLIGRSNDGRGIGSTACYLIRRKRVRPDDAPIASWFPSVRDATPIPRTKRGFVKNEDERITERVTTGER